MYLKHSTLLKCVDQMETHMKISLPCITIYFPCTNISTWRFFFQLSCEHRFLSKCLLLKGFQCSWFIKWHVEGRIIADGTFHKRFICNYMFRKKGLGVHLCSLDFTQYYLLRKIRFPNCARDGEEPVDVGMQWKQFVEFWVFKACHEHYDRY
jgi:hypothetical protein